MDGAADEQVAADLAAGRIGQRLVDPQLVKPGAAFEMEVVQQVDDHIAGRRDEVSFHGRPLLSTGMAPPPFERNDAARRISFMASNGASLMSATASPSSVGAVVEHGHAIADQLDMAELFGGDAGDQTVEGAQLRLAAEIEALEHVVVERRHLAVLAAQQLLQRGGGVGIALLWHRQLGKQLVNPHEHDAVSSSGHERSYRGKRRTCNAAPAFACLQPAHLFPVPEEPVAESLGPDRCVTGTVRSGA